MKKIIYEDFNNWKQDIKIEKITSKKIEEEQKEQEQKIFEGYKVPIWVLDVKNLNGRIYTSELAQKIIDKNEITYALDGHPEEEVNQKIEDIKAIGKNPVIQEGVLYVDCFIVDEVFNNKVETLLALNSRVGLSSVGYGEIENEKIVPETYELIRYFDFVLNPSYGVYLDNDSKSITDENNSNSTEEEKELSTESLETEIDFLIKLKK